MRTCDYNGTQLEFKGRPFTYPPFPVFVIKTSPPPHTGERYFDVRSCLPEPDMFPPKFKSFPELPQELGGLKLEKVIEIIYN